MKKVYAIVAAVVIIILAFAYYYYTVILPTIPFTRFGDVFITQPLKVKYPPNPPDYTPSPQEMAFDKYW